MARVNVELKARDGDPEATAARCRALGAEDHGVLEQRDTYFAGRHGRLKLREQARRPAPGGIRGDAPEAGAELIAYRRADATEPEESAYSRTPVADPAGLAEALDAALGTTVVVTKRRHVFLWEHVRIHLDEVEGLGRFVELEALVGPESGDVATALGRVASLRAELAIADGALVAEGYSDLLLDGVQALLRAADGAMHRAYAPYSEFKVGAALRSASGAIYAGANVENVAFPQGQCAEASAIGALVAAGETAITAVAVVSEKRVICPPCGGCRQRLAEFGGPDTPVHLGRPGSEPHTVTIAGLLPLSFDARHLEP